MAYCISLKKNFVNEKAALRPFDRLRAQGPLS